MHTEVHAGDEINRTLKRDWGGAKGFDVDIFSTQNMHSPVWCRRTTKDCYDIV